MGLSTVSAFKSLNNKNKNLKKLSDKQLKQLQKTILEIADDINFVCQKYHLNYNLGGGSALGAVRHHGFIPWDDDFDINMLRKDYEKFSTVFLKEFGDKYWLHTPEKTKNYGLGFARVRKKGTIYRAREDMENEEAGVYIDIFIIENTYNFVPLRYLHGFLSYVFGFLLSCRNFYKNKDFYLDMVKEDKELSKTFKFKVNIGRLLSWISLDTMTHAWNKVNAMCKNNKSRYVTVPTGRNHFFKEMYERDKFCKTILFDFEKKYKFPVAKDYDGYLKNMYGNYMELPSKNDIEAHIFVDLKL